MGLLRRCLRLAVVGAIGAWIADRWLAARSPDGRPPAIDSRIVLDAPIERAWEALVDIEGQPRWMTEMVEVRVLTPPPVGVGTRGLATVRILGISVTDPVEVTEFHRPRRFAIRHLGTFRGDGRMVLEPGADGTTTILHWDETLIAPVLPHLWAAAARPILADLFQADLRRFQALLASPIGSP